MANYNLFDAASLVMIPTGTKDGKLYSIKPVLAYGSEGVTNSSFSSDTDWTKGDGWSIGGGLASCDGTQTSNSNLFQNNSFEVGKTYHISFTISNYQSGSITLFFGNTIGPSSSSNGVFVQDVVYTSGAYLFLQATSTFVGSVDNVSAKEVVTSDGDFTFTRGSNLAATRVDSAGLIEKGRENVLLQSNGFNNAPWSTSSSDATIGQSGYDGTNDAWLLSKTAINGRAQQNISTSGVKTVSVYAKAGTKNWTNLRIDGGPSVYFDLQNGVLGSASGNISANIESVGNGFYRCSVAFTATISRVRIYVADNNNDTTGTSGNIIIQDSQLEQGLVATAVIETTTASATAGILEDLPRLDYSNGASCPSLLVEQSRTNVFTNSEYFGSWNSSGGTLTANSTNSPEGLKNAYLYTEDTSNNYHRFSKGAIATNSNKVFTVYAKLADGAVNKFLTLDNGPTAWFDLENGTIGSTQGSVVISIESVGNGWYRCIYHNPASSNGGLFIGIAPSNNGLSNHTGSGQPAFYAFGAQCEDNATFQTSYIPTYGDTITRTGDVATSTPSPIDSTGSLSILLGKQQQSTFTVLGESFLAASLVNNIAIAYSPTALKVSLNGAIVVNATGTYDTSSLSSLQLGHLNGADQMSGGVKNLIMFNTFLSDTELNALTV